MRTGDAAPFIAAALAGLAAHPSQHMSAPEDIASRAVAIGFATAKHLADSEDREDFRDEQTINLRVDDTIARAVSDLIERVGALESERADLRDASNADADRISVLEKALADLNAPAPTVKAEPHAKVK